MLKKSGFAMRITEEAKSLVRVNKNPIIKRFSGQIKTTYAD